MGALAIIFAVLSIEAQGGWEVFCIAASVTLGILWWFAGGGT